MIKLDGGRLRPLVHTFPSRWMIITASCSHASRAYFKVFHLHCLRRLPSVLTHIRTNLYHVREIQSLTSTIEHGWDQFIRAHLCTHRIVWKRDSECLTGKPCKRVESLSVWQQCANRVWLLERVEPMPMRIFAKRKMHATNSVHTVHTKATANSSKQNVYDSN